MRTPMRTFVTALLAVVVIVMASVSLASATPRSRPTVLSVYEKPTGFSHVVEESPEGFSPGDTGLEDHPLFDSASQEEVGRANTRYTILRTEGEDALFYLDCEVTVPGGTIVFAGAGRFSELFADGVLFAVTGGTGDYRHTRGTVRVSHAERDGQEIFPLEFQLRP